MLSRGARWTLAFLLVQGVLLWVTLSVPSLGEPMWHHGASLVLVLVLTALVWRQIVDSRRLLVMGVLGFSALATISGFWLLYFKEGIRVDGYQDWGVFWHVLWSWAMAVFFLLHTWINRVAFFHYIRQSLATLSAATVHGGAYVVLLVALVVTWSPTGREWFTNDVYIPLSLYTWLAVAVPPYTLWLALRTRQQLTGAAPPPVLGRRPMRQGVDLALFPVAALTVLSGTVLTFFDGVTDPMGWKYVSKYWHVWPSVGFTVLAFVHGMHTWTTIRAHWRKFQRQSTPRAVAEEPPVTEQEAA